MKNEKGEIVCAGTTTEIVRAVGLKDRGRGGGPTTDYLRIRMALISAKEEVRVKCERRVWALA